ncbi:MAG: AMP-binding protein [Betaproteobacteria bacterium]
MRIETFLQRSAAQFSDKTALVFEDQRFCYRWIEEQANRLANGLIGVGVGRGDRVAVCLDNSVEAVLSIFAILKAGAVFVLLNPAIKPEKFSFMLNDSGAGTLITRAWKAAALGTNMLETPILETLLIAGSAADVQHESKRVVSWNDLMAEYREFAAPPAMPGIDLDLAGLVYTSGSTGRPKGAMMSHLNMVAAATSVTEYLENTASDVILSVLPLSFSYGLYQVLTAFQVGATVVLEKSFAYPHSVLQRMTEEQATGFAIVPTIAATLLQLDLSEHPMEHLRYLTNAGAALPPERVPQLRKRFPGTKLFLMYGLTECKRVSYLAPDQVDRRPDSVGKAMPNMEAYVVDESGRQLPPGEVGELVVRGANVMRGYWNLPDETERVLRPGPVPGERVLHTGDLFRTDGEGYLYYVGRRDDMIKSRGEKVSPTEVENVLYRLDGVSLAAVVGVPDPVLGSAVKAIITLKDGVELSENDVLRHCARFLEEFMLPKVLEFRTTMPRSDSGKIDKRQLIEREEK